MKTKIGNIIPEENILEGESMAKHTSFRVGGDAELFVTVSNEKELQKLMQLLENEAIPHMLVGNGSNLLFADDGYKGIIIKLGGDFEKIDVAGEFITVGAAKLLSGTASFACDNSLTGIEFASGIPGSIGGAIYMNAGAYGGEMKDIVWSVRLMTADGKRVFDVTGDEMEFSYRHSGIQASGEIVLSTVLKLEQGDQEEITARMRELNEKRNSKQPVNYPSAGSTFKRPEGGYAAALIEESGLKGKSVGGAEVSEKHSGFIINKGGATCSDILELMKLVRDQVKKDSGIELEPEVRIIGGSID